MRKILTEAELACLLGVKTTPEQAKGIIARNEGILKLLRARVNGTVKLPCPHCVAAGSVDGCYLCENCEYGIATPDTRIVVCLEYSFGGVCHSDIAGCIGLLAQHVNVTAAYNKNHPMKKIDADKKVKLAIRWAGGTSSGPGRSFDWRSR